MKKMLPSGVELAVLGTVAVLTAVVFATLQPENALLFLSFPLMLTSMLMGARRSGKLGATAAALKTVAVEVQREQAA